MDIDELIYRYLTGKLNLKEQHGLYKLLEEHNISSETLRKIELFWNDPKHQYTKEEDEVYKDIFKKISKSQLEQKRYLNFFQISSNAIRNLSIAATVIILVSVMYFMNDFEGNVELQEVVPVVEHRRAATGQKLTVYLRDGSKVKLNAESSIEFSKYFSDSSRIVSLQGEAFFEVAEDHDRPFQVMVGGIMVQALGTSFSIRNEPGNTKVFLTNGKVSVTSTKEQDHVILTPGLMVSEDNGQLGQIGEFDYADIAWNDNILVFREASSNDVFQQLEKWYGVDIQVQGDLGKWSFSGQFENEPLKEVLLGIGHSEEFEFDIQNKVVVIKKQS
ncbi:MAG: FecR family protein [Bacteroidota bacterium]